MASGEHTHVEGRSWLVRTGSRLARRRLPVVVAVLAIVLTLPSLGNGWMLDDYYHRTVLLGESSLCELFGPPSEMFRFFRGDPERTGPLIDVGFFPWWTDPVLKAEFLQALTVLTHRADYALWPDSPALMHAQSVGWLGTLVAVTAVLYRRMPGASWIAVVAALLFAMDDARGATVGFLANRNVLVASTFGVMAVITHDLGRREGSKLAMCSAPVLLAAALFSKEEGVGTCAYLAAYGLFLDPRGRWRGWLALGPYGVVVLAWATLRASWGYGVRDVGLYIDPVTDTVRFLTAAFERFPILLLGQWSPIPADLAVVLKPPASTLFWGFAVTYLGAIGLLMAPLLRRDRVARFWAAGMLFAAVPVSATIPMDRLLTFVGIGASGLLARYLAFVFRDGVVEGDGGEDGRPTSVFWRFPASALAWWLVATQLVLAPIVLPFRAAHPLGPRWIEERLSVREPLASLEDRTVVIVNAPSPIHANYLLLQRELRGQSVPRAMRVLAPTIPSVTIGRLDERTLMVRPREGYLGFILDRVFRSERKPFASGETITLTGMTVTVTTLTDEGRPAEATFRFDVPLESSNLLWLCYRDGAFEPFTPPEEGEEVEIPFDWRAVLSPIR